MCEWGYERTCWGVGKDLRCSCLVRVVRDTEAASDWVYMAKNGSCGGGAEHRSTAAEVDCEAAIAGSELGDARRGKKVILSVRSKGTQGEAHHIGVLHARCPHAAGAHGCL